MSILLGLDIGGTKCAVSVGEEAAEGIRILRREAIATPKDQRTAMEAMLALAGKLAQGQAVAGVGISAGGPLDAESGMLCNPPNLPGWHKLSLTRMASDALHAPSVLENDANACALAEWRWGAGQGSRVMAFLTFGTGLGAGIVLDGHILRGATGDAGELGHWRLSGFGPSGYGKAGSFEGYCSGGGLGQLAVTIGERYCQQGMAPSYVLAGAYDAKTVADAARAGDAAALEVFRVCGESLGRGLALLVDFLNPDRIVLGSIYARCSDLLTPPMEAVLRAESLPRSLAACSVKPAALGESIGDYAALALAKQAADKPC
ncbi:MAG: ROK family protein [Candidatus Limiplasma sp.]|nr:ROK family protein [Candidatus Limiplasma sp.]MEA5146275.1 ROK family protein [Candidatus Limiplasma sp.]